MAIQFKKKKKKQKQATSLTNQPNVLPLTTDFKLPPPHFMERTMGTMFGLGDNSKDNPKWIAQDLFYEAMEASNPSDTKKLIRQALEMDPRCVDALVWTALGNQGTLGRHIESLKEIVAIAEEDFGAEFMKDNVGFFWGLLETRPYMRLCAQLSEMLADAGRYEEAIAVCEKLLYLNPNDNQGIRYLLTGYYLTANRLERLRKLFEEFPDEIAANFAWAKVLERFLSQDIDGAKKELVNARKVNSGVEKYLLGKKQIPQQLPDYVGIGDENEAITCAYELNEVLLRNKTAVAWLKMTK